VPRRAPEDEPPEAEALKKPEMLFGGCRTPIFRCISPVRKRMRGALRTDLRPLQRNLFPYLDAFGDPVVRPAPPALAFHQVGFEREEALFPTITACLRASISFVSFSVPRKFLGCNLTRLGEVLPHLRAKTIDILSLSTRSIRASSLRPAAMFAMYAAPAVNLFEKSTDRIPLKSNQHEYQVVPDRSHYLATNRIACWRCTPIFRAGGKKCRCRRSIRHPSRGQNPSGLHFTCGRLPRRAHGRGKAHGCSSDLPGTGHVHFLEHARGTDDDAAMRN